MEFLGALLMTASLQPHDMRAHHIGSFFTYSLLFFFPKPRRYIRKVELQISPSQKILMGTLFALSSIMQTAAHPLDRLFLPLFLGTFQDFSLSLFGGFFAAFLSKYPFAILNILSLSLLSLFGAHDQRTCIGAAALLHLFCIPFFQGYDGISLGAYASVSRFLFLQSSPLHLRSLLLLSPLSLLDLFRAEQLELIYLPSLLFLFLLKPGRDIFPFLTIPIGIALAFARHEGLLS